MALPRDITWLPYVNLCGILSCLTDKMSRELYLDSAKPKSEARTFFPHVSRAQRLAPARTRTWVVRLGADSEPTRSPVHWPLDYWKSKFFRLDGLLLPFCIRSASSAIMYYAELQTDTIHYNLFLVHLATLPFKRPSLYAFMAFLEFTHTREV